MNTSLKLIMAVFLTAAMIMLPACTAQNQESESYDLFAEEEQYEDFKMVKYVLTPAAEIGDEELESMTETMITRLTEIYQYRNNFKVQDGKIYVLIEDIPNVEEVLKEISARDNMTMQNADGEVVFDASGISSATAKYGILTQGGEKQHYVELVFTQKGRTEFSAVTKAISERADGNNNIYIVIDETPVTALTAKSEISSKTCRITGNFTEEEAKKLAVTITSGAISTDFTIEKYVEPAKTEAE